MNWIARYYDVDWVCTGEPDVRIDYAVHQDDIWTVHVESAGDQVTWTVRGFQRHIIGTGPVTTYRKQQIALVNAGMRLGLYVMREAQAERAEWEATWQAADWAEGESDSDES